MTKQKIFILGLILAVFLVTGVGAIAQADNTLTASISAASTANVGEDVSFSVTATGGNGDYTYVWDFGDGTQAAGQAPVHSYATAGAKTVSVVVGDTDNNQVSASHEITILEVTPPTPISANITAPTSGATFNIGEDINFSVTATGGNGDYTYVWDFGDGTQAAGQAPVHSYATAGAKTVSVVVGDTDNNQTNASVNFTIQSATNQPSLTFTANGQTGSITVSTTTTTTLAWSSANVTACTASGDWSGDKGTSGSTTVGPFAASSAKTFTLTCTGAGGSVSHSITVTTSDNPATTELTISNVRVTDVTKNSAIVRWDTNLPANSRVIYDTVSHPDISGQSAPKYGYAFTTDTDSTLVTNHAVTVTGLSPDTKYYFRVISEN